MPFETLFVLAFCGDCGWHSRAENPTPADQARIVRHSQAHARDTRHNVCIERGQAYFPRGVSTFDQARSVSPLRVVKKEAG